MRIMDRAIECLAGTIRYQKMELERLDRLIKQYEDDLKSAKDSKESMLATLTDFEKAITALTVANSPKTGSPENGHDR